MSIFLIPLRGIAESFEISLAGVNYLLTVKWNNSPDAGWIFDLDNADTNVSILAGAPFITGDNCLDGLDYLGIQGQIIVFTDGNADAVPTYTNLGTESNLYFTTSVVNA